jgi:gluconolactonase
MVCAAPGGHYQRFDSMAVDTFGNVCVATLIHGGISIVAPDGRCTGHVALPDRFTTNLCFGGRDRRTAFVTLSGSGRLIAIDGWPVPGLKLNFEA